MCDAVHHFTPEFRKQVFDSIKDKKFRYVMIKDIDCRKKFGNMMNRMHDLIINRELVGDVNPEELGSFLKKNGYQLSCHFLPRLWYPHFLLLAERNEK